VLHSGDLLPIFNLLLISRMADQSQLPQMKIRMTTNRLRYDDLLSFRTTIVVFLNSAPLLENNEAHNH
jgi:hypothetical protein